MFFFFFCKNRYFDAPTLQLQENGETAMLSNAYLSESCKKVRRLFFAFCGRKKNPEILNFQNRWLKVHWKISRERSVARTSLKSLAAFDIHTYCHRYDFFSHEERITSFLRCLQRSLRSQVQTSCYRLVTIKKERAPLAHFMLFLKCMQSHLL